MVPKSKLCLTIVLLLCLLPCASAWAQETAAPPARAEQIDKLVERIWWNNEKRTEGLDLSPEVRHQMDQIARDFLANSTLETQLGLQREIADALVRAEWETVEAKGEALAQAVADPVRRQVQLKADIFRLMTPAQREKLQKQSPFLLSRAWVRMTVGPAGGRGEGSRRTH